MQSINDDMDELFRKAGEEYPLNTNGGDFDKVLQKLQQPDDSLPVEPKKGKDRRYLLLLLLLPLGFLIGRYLGYKEPTSSPVEQNVSTTTNQQRQLPNLNSNAQVYNEKKIGGDDKEKVSIDEETAAKSRSNNIVETKETKGIGNFSKATSTSISNTERLGLQQTIDLASVNQKAKQENLVSNNGKITDEREEVNNNISRRQSELQKIDDQQPEAVVSKNDAPAKIKETNDTSAVAKANAKTTDTLESKKKIASNINELKNKLYYAVVAGPDFSSVKFNKSDKTGYSIGVMLGYNINKKVSIEAGVLLDRKNYNATGEYLDTSKLKLPSHSVVSNVIGYCDMFEIPVNLQYRFINKNSHSWLVSAGISSYLMKKEDYNIKYERYGQFYAKDYGYDKSSKDWGSIMNVSVGYQKLINKKTSIRVAPYIKLPLRGVGIGKLPITSTGVYVSLSRPAW